MNKMQTQVRDFHRVVLAGPTSPAVPEIRHGELRSQLILEEAIETAVALVGIERASEILRERSHKLAKIVLDAEETGEWPEGAIVQPNVEEALDGVCDLIYVSLGTAEDIGVDIEPFYDEVHRSNMAKCDPEKKQLASKTPLGKVIKPANWTPPDIAGVLVEQSTEFGRLVAGVRRAAQEYPLVYGQGAGSRELRVLALLSSSGVESVTRETIEKAIDVVDSGKRWRGEGQ